MSQALDASDGGAGGTSLLTAWAGPLAIVAAIAFGMRGFIFTDSLTNQHPDILSFWLPRWCFLGNSLAHGHVPLWNPYLQAGTPYASDPQSGWLNAPVMLLFSTLSCTSALRAFIVLQPLLAGLGLYAFMRREGVIRIAATMGGLSVAMIMCASSIGVALPFAGTLAWTPWVMLGASGWLSSKAWWRRLLWLALAAFAWSQVATSHMSHGLFMCTLMVAVYLLAKLWTRVRRKEIGWVSALGLGLGFMAFLPASSLAVFLPRLALTARSSLANGYAAVDRITPGVGTQTIADSGVWAAWPLAIGATPGAYAGAAILLCVPAALRNRNRRTLVISLFAASAIVYVMSLSFLVQASWFRSLVIRLPFGDVYLHNPSRLRLLLLFTVPALGALGFEGLMSSRPSTRSLLGWLGAGVALWLLLPLALGAYPKRFIVLGVATVLTISLIWFVCTHRPAWAVSVAALLFIELCASAYVSQTYHGGAAYIGLEPHVAWIQAEQTLAPGPLRYPNVDASAYTTPGPIALAMEGKQGRFVDWAPPAAYFLKGYLFMQTEQDWPALFNARGMLFGLSDPTGYNPVQLARYWDFVRASNPLPIYYNASVLQNPTLSELRLLGTRFVITPKGLPPTVGAEQVVTEGAWALWQVNGWEPMASLVNNWSPARDGAQALAAVTAPGFDPAKTAVIEGPVPTIPSYLGELPPTSVGFRQISSDQASLTFFSHVPAFLVVRQAYDNGWSATIDGKTAQVLPTDYFLQGIAVPGGKHTVVLTYHDPKVYEGLAFSAVVWMLLAVAIVASLVRSKRYEAALASPA
jgi:hypothetical protein